jgi:hypothetical protein
MQFVRNGGEELANHRGLTICTHQGCSQDSRAVRELGVDATVGLFFIDKSFAPLC